MSNSTLPRDTNSVPIQVLAPVESTVVNFVLAATTNPHSLPAGSQIVEVAVTGNCQFAFGASGVSAVGSGARVLTPGVYVYKVPYSNGLVLADHFDAVTVDGSSGRVTVAQLV